jgi:hypothetical protein
MTTRKYSSRSQQTTLSGALTSSATTTTVVSGSSLLGGVTVSAGEIFTVVIDPDTALEEIVDVSATSGNTLTIVRGIDGSTGVAHSAGAIVRHMAIGRDYREANTHIEATTGHGATGAVVGTTNTQTLTNKTLTSPTITGTGAIAGTFTGNLTGNVTGTVSGNAGSVTNGVYTTDTGTVTSTMIANGAIVNADINASAAIDKTKVSGTAVTVADTGTVTSTMIANDTIVNADINTSAQIAYSKINATNSIVNADVNASAAIDKTKISGTAITAGDTGTVTSTMIADGTIVNGDINASAAIDWTKLGISSTVSSTEIGYVDGVTSAIQTQLDAKLATATAASTYAPLASPALTGVPTAPTAAANTNTTQIATTAYVQTEIADLIAAAPGALDTLDELAAALGDDAAFSTTVTNSIATKLPLAGGTMSGAIAMGTNKITGLGTPTTSTDASTKAYVDTMLPLAGGTMSGAIAMGTNKITGLGTPTASTDAATKGYIDTTVLAPSNLTGPITSVGAATSIASQTGTGTKFVMDNTPTLITPVLGVATATSINGTTIPASKTLVATDSTQYVVPSQTGNSGKYLTTNGTASSWASPVPAVSVATTLNTYTAFSAQPLGGQVLNVSFNTFSLSQYGFYVQNDADIFNAAFPVGSVITATSATQTGTFTVASAATINGGGSIILNITTSEPSNIFFSGATTLTAGVSTSGKYLTNDGTTSSWGTITSYSAPTLGSTSIASGATVTNVNALTVNSTTIPTSKTLVVTTDKLSALAATTSAELAGVISDETGSGSLVFGTSPTITPAAGTTTTGATGAGYMGLPQNSTTTGAYTITAADAGKHIYSTATRTITIDSNANLALPIGTTIVFVAGTGATATIAITTDTLLLAGAGTTGSRTLAPFGMATAVKIAGTTWIISGNGLS